jgi:calcineurin-like phosphoesterase family protein
MASSCTLGILSDIHYASAAERARGTDYEIAPIPNPALRRLVWFYRHFFWLRSPLNQNHLLDGFLKRTAGFDYVIANGDYSCDSASIGTSDDAAAESVRECLQKIRVAFEGRFFATFGDHELGKISFFGGRGGMRLASWHRARQELGLEPLWQLHLGKYVLVGVVSSLIALPVFEPDTLPQERLEWEELRAEHLRQIGELFANIQPERRILLFCHDPTALPFLGRQPEVAKRLPQIESTIIGHLHSGLILWKSRRLAGIPQINFLGHTAKRLSKALRQAREWRPFRVRLCPSLAGIELLKDGGYLTARLDLEGRVPAQIQFHPLPRSG